MEREDPRDSYRGAGAWGLRLLASASSVHPRGDHVEWTIGEPSGMELIAVVGDGAEYTPHRQESGRCVNRHAEIGRLWSVWNGQVIGLRLRSRGRRTRF